MNSLKHTGRSLAVALMAMLMACDAEPLYDTEYPVSFSFNVGWHQGTIAEDALSIAGTFVFISIPTDGNQRFVITPNNVEREEQLLPVSEIEQRAIEAQRQSAFGSMGINRRLLVGKTIFDGTLTAYDGHCPNCHHDTGKRDYPLTWADNRQYLLCNTCGRTYNPNIGGAPTNAKSKSDLRLKLYRASYANNVLTVRN